MVCSVMHDQIPRCLGVKHENLIKQLVTLFLKSQESKEQALMYSYNYKKVPQV